MVCNHSSHFDAVCLLASLPLRRVHHAFPVAAADYFFSTPLRSFLSVVVVNGLPFDRLQHGSASLDVCREILREPNNILIMFPEGTRSGSELHRQHEQPGQHPGRARHRSRGGRTRRRAIAGRRCRARVSYA